MSKINTYSPGSQAYTFHQCFISPFESYEARAAVLIYFRVQIYVAFNEFIICFK